MVARGPGDTLLRGRWYFCGELGDGVSGVLCFSLGSRVRGNDGETRKKPGAVFNPVFWRERSWICASTEFRWRLRRSFLRIGLLPTVQY